MNFCLAEGMLVCGPAAQTAALPRAIVSSYTNLHSNARVYEATRGGWGAGNSALWALAPADTDRTNRAGQEAGQRQQRHRAAESGVPVIRANISYAKTIREISRDETEMALSAKLKYLFKQTAPRPPLVSEQKQ